MQSETAIDKQADVRGRRRRRGKASAEGPVFVDNSGRRSKLLRRLGLLVGVTCLGYAVVLGMAFMGVGTSLTPSELLPFGGGGPAGAPNSGPGGAQPQGGVGTPPVKPTGMPPTGTATGEPPASAPTVSASASAAAAN
ncbi:hypothetical protein [Streptomyces cyaneus]|uniref:hypothetical protein n=1 Tax=Streptomyces cyaneus TaxID=1904 RepID=UPI000FF8A1FF|nr:hypothetical protein [Streptomyces cyaneus]